VKLLSANHQFACHIKILFSGSEPTSLFGNMSYRNADKFLHMVVLTVCDSLVKTVFLSVGDSLKTGKLSHNTPMEAQRGEEP
jgi:hypothetical protein